MMETTMAASVEAIAADIIVAHAPPPAMGRAAFA
jgi:hypothetical protein